MESAKESYLTKEPINRIKKILAPRSHTARTDWGSLLRDDFLNTVLMRAKIRLVNRLVGVLFCKPLANRGRS
jgi:hypothetical protein